MIRRGGNNTMHTDTYNIFLLRGVASFSSGAETTTALFKKLAIPAPNLLTYCSASSPFVFNVSVVLLKNKSASSKRFSATAGNVFLNKSLAVELISLVPELSVWVKVCAPALKRLAVLAKLSDADLSPRGVVVDVLVPVASVAFLSS